jgi:hypothetical protein
MELVLVAIAKISLDVPIAMLTCHATYFPWS